MVRFLGRTGSSLFFERKVGTKLKHPQPASLPGFDTQRLAAQESGAMGGQGKAVGFPRPAALLFARVATSGPGEQQKGPVSGSLKKC